MKASRKFEMEFHSMQFDTFWCTQPDTFPQLVETALEDLVPFARKYSCESGFSALLHIRTKARNRSEPGDDMQVVIANKEPRYNMIIDKKTTTKEPLSSPCLIVGVLLISLYNYIRCNNMFVCINTIWFQAKGGRRFYKSSGVRGRKKVWSHCVSVCPKQKSLFVVFARSGFETKLQRI